MAGTISYVRRRSSSVCCDSNLPWDKFHYWIHCICVVTFDLEIGQTMELILPKGAKLTEKEVDDDHYFGFVYFRQAKDKSIPRGYLQKSFVILTKLPFVNLFYQLVEKIAPEFFRFSLPSLETACNEIDHWPLPTPGSSLNLPLMGAIIQVYLPSKHENSTYILTRMNLPCETLATPTYFIASAYEPNFYEYLSPVLSHLHLLWEVVLLGEPLAVMASSPSICSNVVHSLITLIFPLRPDPDYRPFFTIHDSEFREFTSKTKAPPNIVLGVTNPFFTKTLEHWPNVLRIGESTETSSAKSSPALNHKVKKGGNLKILDSKPGLYTKYKPFLTKDKTLLKKILKGIEARRPTEVQGAILRRYFHEMTQSFLMPLERYMTSLMPLQKKISPFKAVPCVAPFVKDDFFHMLDVSGSHFTSSVKGDWTGLYKKFFMGPIFKLWLEQRQKEIDDKLQMLHLDVLCSAPLYSTTSNEKREIELIDIVLKLRDKLNFIDDNKDRVTQQMRSRIVEHYHVFLNALPDDMKSVLQSNHKLLPKHSTVSNRSSSASPPTYS